MQVIATFDELRKIDCPVHWAMGVFDGIHIGHRFIISSAGRAKDDKGGLLGVLTFDRHPMHTIRPGQAPLRIFSDEREKEELLAGLGVDVLLNLHFDRDMAALSAREFLDLLEGACRVGSISVGNDWRFGKGREGDIHMLEEEGIRQGFAVYAHPHVVWNSERVSSTRIRDHIRKGDLGGVRDMLGRPYSISGEVVSGKQLGRQLGFPTANIRPGNEQIPPFGVYAVQAMIDGTMAGGIANLGKRPTVDNDTHELLLETHFFDLDADLYGRNLKVDLLEFIRPEMKFDSLDELKNRIAKDCEIARKSLRSAE